MSRAYLHVFSIRSGSMDEGISSIWLVSVVLVHFLQNIKKTSSQCLFLPVCYFVSSKSFSLNFLQETNESRMKTKVKQVLTNYETIDIIVQASSRTSKDTLLCLNLLQSFTNWMLFFFLVSKTSTYLSDINSNYRYRLVTVTVIVELPLSSIVWSINKINHFHEVFAKVVDREIGNRTDSFFKKIKVIFHFCSFCHQYTSNNTSAITANTTITNNNHCTKNEVSH